jgi:UDPglucose--hexose-1-phosphate uridylyltransferase
MNINTEIKRLLNFAKQRGLISEDYYYYSANLLIDVLHVGEFAPEDIEENLETAAPILENMLAYAVQEKLIEDTAAERDLFDTRIMNCVMPRPSEVVR